MIHYGFFNYFPFNGFVWNIEYKERLGLLFSLINQAHGLFFLVTFLFFIVLGLAPAIRQRRKHLKHP